MGHKIRQAPAEGKENYKLTGLIEMADTYFVTPKPGKRSRGTAGKAKVVIGVELPAGEFVKFGPTGLTSKPAAAETIKSPSITFWTAKWSSFCNYIFRHRWAEYSVITRGSKSLRVFNYINLMEKLLQSPYILLDKRI